MNEYKLRGIRKIGYEIKEFIKNMLKNFFAIEFIVLLIPVLIAWELLPKYNIIPSSLLPNLSETIKTFIFLFKEKELVLHINYSLFRFFTAFFLALITAVPIGILIGWNVKIRKGLLPFFQLLSPIPPPAWYRI